MTVLYVVLIYWVVPWFLSELFLGWLLFVSKDIKFEGYVWLWRFIPVMRYRLVSRKSWYARAWERFYGQALFLAMIHRDEPGELDDEHVEKTIVHELRHVVQLWVGGIVTVIVYLEEHARCGYSDNWFERDARSSVDRWLEKGRPRIYNFGRRR